MISKKAIPRYESEKANLQRLISLIDIELKNDDIHPSWERFFIEQKENYEKRILRINELIEQVHEYHSNPLTIVTNQLLGENRGSTFR